MLWNLLFGLCILGLNKYGDYISYECPQAGYACPKICDVDHKHYPREECNGKEKKEKSSKRLQEDDKSLQEENWKAVLRRGFKNAETEQESRSDTTSVQPVE